MLVEPPLIDPVVQEPEVCEIAEVPVATCDPVHQEEEPILINELKNESSLQFQAEDPTPETPSQHASEECKVVTKLDHIPSIKPPKVFDNEDSNDSSQCLGEERVSRYNSVLREIP